MKQAKLMMVLALAAAPAAHAGNWATEPALGEGQYYVAPMLTWMQADHDRGTDDGFGLAVAGGLKLHDRFALELAASYLGADAETGDDTLKLTGVGVNALVFPSRV